MIFSCFLRVLLVTELIGFTSRADAACLTNGTLPTERPAFECSDIEVGFDYAPKPARVKQSKPQCAVTCVALANAPKVSLLSPPQLKIGADAMVARKIASPNQRPPTPPPRGQPYHSIYSIHFTGEL